MKIKTTQSDLKAALAKLADVVPSNPSMPILACVRLEGNPDGKGISLLATNMDMTVKTNFKCEVSEPSVAIVSYRLLSGVVNASVAGVIELDTTGGNLKVTTPTGKSRIQLMADELFPKDTREDNERRILISGDALSTMLKQVEFAIAPKTESRKVLNNTLLQFAGGVASAVATNGNTLAISNSEGEQIKDSGEGELRIIVPEAASKLVRRILGEGEAEILIPEKKGYAVFAAGGTVVKTKLFDGDYPAYEKVIPPKESEYAPVKVAVANLVAALRRVAVFIDSSFGTPYVILNFTDNRIVVSSPTSDVGEAKDGVAIEGSFQKPLQIRFNPFIVTAALSAAVNDKVELTLYSDTKPMKVKDGDGYLAVMMPIRAQ